MKKSVLKNVFQHAQYFWDFTALLTKKAEQHVKKTEQHVKTIMIGRPFEMTSIYRLKHLSPVKGRVLWESTTIPEDAEFIASISYRLNTGSKWSDGVEGLWSKHETETSTATLKIEGDVITGITTLRKVVGNLDYAGEPFIFVNEEDGSFLLMYKCQMIDYQENMHNSHVSFTIEAYSDMTRGWNDRLGITFIPMKKHVAKDFLIGYS